MSITIIGYIKDIPDDFDKEEPKWDSTKSSAAPNNFFVVNKYWKKMKQKKVVEFHNLAAKTFYASKRERPGTCTVIVFF